MHARHSSHNGPQSAPAVKPIVSERTITIENTFERKRHSQKRKLKKRLSYRAHTQVPRYRSDVTKKRAKNCEGCPSMLNPFSYETRRACGTHAHMDDFMQRSVLCAIDIGEMLHRPISCGSQPKCSPHSPQSVPKYMRQQRANTLLQAGGLMVAFASL